MLRNRPAATLIAIVVLAAWPAATFAAAQVRSHLTLTPPSWLAPASGASQRTSPVTPLPRTGSDLAREGLVAIAFIAAGFALRFGWSRGRA